LKQEEKKKVAYHDAFDASNLNELKNKIVECEIKLVLIMQDLENTNEI
jgi:hypothetical protein